MKKHFSVFLIALFLLLSFGLSVEAKECPNPKSLAETSIDDRGELLKALESMVPNFYEGEQFSDWKVISATPFPMTIGKREEEVYFEIAKRACGGEAAEKSWLVRLYFPLLADVSASLSEGQLFVAKKKDSDWFVWYQYH